MNPLKSLLYLLVSLVLSAGTAWASQTTMTTYYPSPTGYYNTLYANNVGIGTTLPAAARLKVVGSGTGYAAFNDGGCGGNFAGLTLNGSIPSTCATYNVLSDPSDNILYINRPTGGNIQFRENNADQMMILSGGNVGIGITAPAAQLHLFNSTHGGDLGIGQQSDNTPYMRLGMDTGWDQYLANNAYWTGAAYNYVNAAGYGGTASAIHQVSGTIEFDTASGGTNPITWSDRMLITNAGNIGIGVSPSELLDVGGVIRSNNEIIGSALGGSGQFRMIAGNYGAFFRNDGANTYFLLTASGNQYGTWNALRPLYINDVSGDVAMGSNLSLTGGNLAVTGNITATGTITASSDQRLKKDIRPITHALDKVQRLNGVSFRWKKTEAKDIGVIAQNLEEVLPEIVHTGQNGMKGIEYGNLTALLIEAVKEQQKEINALQERVKTLEKK